MNLKALTRGGRSQASQKPQDEPQTVERYSDLNAARADLRRNLRRAEGEFQQVVTEINLDNAGPMNASARRNLYPTAFKAYKKAVAEAFDLAIAGIQADE